jgi:hypothetical protein
MASRGHQVPSQRAFLGRPGVRQLIDEPSGSGSERPRRRKDRYEVLLVRHARVQVRNQR